MGGGGLEINLGYQTFFPYTSPTKEVFHSSQHDGDNSAREENEAGAKREVYDGFRD